jgi:UDP-glucose:(heptosyl)LPS alpha-1,3-glucosyltransferase
MNLLFSLFNYFPHGGQQRNCLRIAQKCAESGHKVTLYTRTWDGPKPKEIKIITLGCKGWTNASRNQNYIKELIKEIDKGSFDGVIAFNKMPRLDLYFASDPCFKAKFQSANKWLSRLTKRYRLYSNWEKAVFEKGQKTQILLITDREIPLYQKFYKTEKERFHLLPPNIDKRQFTDKDKLNAYNTKRKELGLSTSSTILLMVGSSYHTKGVDRAIKGLAAISLIKEKKIHLVILGHGKAKKYKHLAKSLNVLELVHFLGGRNDVPEWMLAANLLIHPARNENTGTVLLEAMGNGLPLLVSAVCGYAFHVEKAKSGKIIPSPFSQKKFNELLQEMVDSPHLSNWSEKGLNYAATEDLYSCHDTAYKLIEKFVTEKNHDSL